MHFEDLQGSYKYTTIYRIIGVLRQAGVFNGTQTDLSAKVLGAFLTKYAKIGYLDFHGENKKKIFMHLHEFCPSMRSYKYSNFVANF